MDDAKTPASDQSPLLVRDVLPPIPPGAECVHVQKNLKGSL